MARYDIPVQENGRMILPAELRRALGVGKGDRVVILTTEDGVELTTAQRARRRAQERFRRLVPEGVGIVDEFLAEKRAEVAREDARDALRVAPSDPPPVGQLLRAGPGGPMTAAVFDTSALLAHLNRETGAEVVEAWLDRGGSALAVQELTKTIAERGGTREDADVTVDDLGLAVHDVTRDLALDAGAMGEHDEAEGSERGRPGLPRAGPPSGGDGGDGGPVLGGRRGRGRGAGGADPVRSGRRRVCRLQARPARPEPPPGTPPLLATPVGLTSGQGPAGVAVWGP